MRLLIIMMVLTGALFAQERIYDPAVYGNSDSTITRDFAVADSFQVLLAVTDTVDVDVYVQYSATGLTWTSTAKLLDFVTEEAKDTALFYPTVNYPITRARLYLDFASSGNDPDSSGRFSALIKHFGK